MTRVEWLLIEPLWRRGELRCGVSSAAMLLRTLMNAFDH